MAASESEPVLHVIVQNLVGKEVELEIPHSRTVRDLKALVDEKWGLPLAAQQMMVGTTVLENGWPVTKLCDEVPDGEQLRVLCVFSLPYDGDIQLASRAGDRDAVRLLIKERDKDRGKQQVPAILKLLMFPRLRHQRGWPSISAALTERGYTEEEVVAALETSSDNCSYSEVLQHLELNIRKIPDSDVPFLSWWRKTP
mmetsp:Transcript_8490/g.14715  ORF Transcript_8490/g.14715 Transcript_8490/m.14715 type:complete len:198 (-) Transcript_8490:40-633(-)